ncbi:helix-turn-helix transcriptional regulator [Paenibacillus sp. FSL H8-0104]|uniref:Transcriptional regulator n=1 Tax=Paenibacillus amylolyticus TaxID=1451 RepID=A0A1R1BPV3_PAEAM|nr:MULTISPECIES: helix-turn-helix transcriptional regulator [Paenibacillus]OMF11775.1 transcriptional regulator [Paenibacillus amylolyticus]WJM09281.1 helix-turn-helix transcriptional regulator [Paenibacillus sp. PK1-4R]
MSELLELVGARIRDLRKSRDLSQEALAENAGFNPSYIGFIERAERNISLKNLEKIAAALDVGVYELFTYVKEREDLSQDDSNITKIISLLRTHEPKHILMVLNIITEIFDTYDKN